MDPPTESATRNIITPKRHLANLQVYILFHSYFFIINLCDLRDLFTIKKNVIESK